MRGVSGEGEGSGEDERGGSVGYLGIYLAAMLNRCVKLDLPQAEYVFSFFKAYYIYNIKKRTKKEGRIR